MACFGYLQDCRTDTLPTELLPCRDEAVRTGTHLKYAKPLLFVPGRLRTCTSAALGRSHEAFARHARHRSAASCGHCSGALRPLTCPALVVHALEQVLADANTRLSKQRSSLQSHHCHELMACVHCAACLRILMRIVLKKRSTTDQTRKQQPYSNRHALTIQHKNGAQVRCKFDLNAAACFCGMRRCARAPQRFKWSPLIGSLAADDLMHEHAKAETHNGNSDEGIWCCALLHFTFHGAIC